jgi:hypothetical protein
VVRTPLHTSCPRGIKDTSQGTCPMTPTGLQDDTTLNEKPIPASRATSETYFRKRCPSTFGSHLAKMRTSTGATFGTLQPVVKRSCSYTSPLSTKSKYRFSLDCRSERCLRSSTQSQSSTRVTKTRSVPFSIPRKSTVFVCSSRIRTSTAFESEPSCLVDGHHIRHWVNAATPASIISCSSPRATTRCSTRAASRWSATRRCGSGRSAIRGSGR